MKPSLWCLNTTCDKCSADTTHTGDGIMYDVSSQRAARFGSCQPARTEKHTNADAVLSRPDGTMTDKQRRYAMLSLIKIGLSVLSILVMTSPLAFSQSGSGGAGTGGSSGKGGTQQSQQMMHQERMQEQAQGKESPQGQSSSTRQEEAAKMPQKSQKSGK